MEVKCFQKGLKKDEKGFLGARRATGKKESLRPFYFPMGLLEKNKAKYALAGKTSYVFVNGQRTRLGTKFLYYLSPSFTVRQDLLDNFSVLMRVRLLTTSKNGDPVTPRKALSWRKSVCRNWWNHQWLSRYLAVLQFLSDEDGKIIVGAGSEAVEFAASFASFETNFSIIEELLGSDRTDDEERFLNAMLEDDEDMEGMDNG